MFDLSCAGCSDNSCGACGGCGNAGYNDYDSTFMDAFSSCGGCSSAPSFGKIKKTSTMDVKMAIAEEEYMDMYCLHFEKLDDLPNLNNWRHCCKDAAISVFVPNQLWFLDGSCVVYIFCPACCTVHYYFEKAY